MSASTVAVNLSDPYAVTILSVALLTVWLDGLFTDMGLRRGALEANPVIRGLQRLMGRMKGLVVSRLVLTGLLACVFLIEYDSYALFIILSVFSFGALYNLRILTSSASAESVEKRAQQPVGSIPPQSPSHSLQQRPLSIDPVRMQGERVRLYPPTT